MGLDAFAARILLHVGGLALSLIGLLRAFREASGALASVGQKAPSQGLPRDSGPPTAAGLQHRMFNGKGATCFQMSEVGPSGDLKRQRFLLDDPDILRYTDEEYPNTSDLVRTPCG